MFKLILKLSLFILLIPSCNKSSSLNLALTPLQSNSILDPSKVFFLNEYYLIENLATRLVEIDSKHGYKLMLASEIKQISDKEYSVKIKESYFSNGERIQLEDVKESFNRALRLKNNYLNISEVIKDVVIKEDYLIIRLLKKSSDLFHFMSLVDLSILHKTQLKDELKAEDWGKATSGAFTYQFDDQGNSKIVKNKYFMLSSFNYPEVFNLRKVKGRNSFNDYKHSLVDIGVFNLNSYNLHASEFVNHKNLQIIGNKGDMINFLALNSDDSKFSSEYNRRWIMKKILLGFQIDKNYGQIAEKAFQFFTPRAKGFLDEDVIMREVLSWKLDLNSIPNEFKNGLTITTYERAFEVTLESVVKQLEGVLGIPVQIKNIVQSKDFERTIKNRDFEIFLGITSMDTVIVSEVVNLYYFSSSPMFKDINKKILPLMRQYSLKGGSEAVTLLKKLSFQIVQDSECIPLFYVASPFFYNKDKVNVSGLDELTHFNLWKIQEL